MATTATDEALCSTAASTGDSAPPAPISKPTAFTAIDMALCRPVLEAILAAFADAPDQAVSTVVELLGKHRVWDRLLQAPEKDLP